MNRLPSGSILPSGLLQVDQETMVAHNTTFNNTSLKMGIITTVYEIDDANNVSKLVPEYDVMVIEKRGESAPTPITYKNCPTVEMFGGIGDFLEFRYRTQSKAEKKEKDGAKIARYQDGAVVLILCLNGFNETGIIIGGAKHPKRKTKLKKDSGHTLVAEFNGLGLEVDKEGALTISFKGKTDSEGKPLDAKVGGSFIKIKKNGSIEMSDGKKERIAFDKEAESTDLQSGKAMKIDAGKTLDINVGDSAKINIKKTLLLQSQGSATLKFKDLKAEFQGPAMIQGPSIDMKIQGMTMITSPQITLVGSIFLGAAGGAPAPTGQTMYLGTGNLGAPVISQAIGPFSNTVFLG